MGKDDTGGGGKPSQGKTDSDGKPESDRTHFSGGARVGNTNSMAGLQDGSKPHFGQSIVGERARSETKSNPFGRVDKSTGRSTLRNLEDTQAAESGDGGEQRCGGPRVNHPPGAN